MKLLITSLILLAWTISCKNAETKTVAPVVVKDSTMHTTRVKKDFGNAVFASKKDLSCGMPLTAGLEDTAHYKGKVYGFCSAECKADFVQHAAAYTK